MSKEFSAVARSVVEKLGGANNVVALTHCMTRLRFVLKDEAKIDAAAIKGVKGVMGVVRNGDQCQVIIGNNVAAAYKEVMKLCNFDGVPSEYTPAPKVKLTPKVIGAKMLDALVGTMSPLIPAIIGGSMVKLAAMLLLMFNIYEADHSTIILLNTIGDGAFFFLPIMVAASAAIKFKTNMSLAIGIAGVLVHPNFIDLMAQAADGRAVELFGIPVTSVRYTYTVIPVLIMTWIQSYIERWVDSITPAVTKNFLKPMLIVLIAAPIGILLVGPMGIWIGTAISTLVYTIHGALGPLAVAIMGALWPLLVLTGMHRVFTPTIIQTIAETGTEGMVMPSEIGANIGMGGACLAVAWKTKNIALKQTSMAAGASALMAGISEPALYGVLVRLKRPLIATLITGFIVGGLAGMAGIASHSMAAPSLFTSVQFIDVNDPMSLVWVLGLMALSVVLSFVLTLVLGFEDIPNDEDEANPTAAKESAKESAEEVETPVPAKPATA
ncbi:PTS cellobiose/arbutin/salicin transporter subunit IIBC [Photobacterium rosenbergii]|uniref:PTS cellobiose/arbutin/salicin transporter subunit IIBC n=1 Tax=Photobacterium rosenbergii TaxID=294936 RepID=A0ABU3ZPW3_9GAMM|nr:PTS cellobiose/arbutin/salicin transporter subunit IIBC [Photobacterium rosenbergii]MDV5172156.1 PTS cellobiose/arbutin/salicin transporter subunit IIBC [Photobacterium rosenbergii]